MTDYNLIAKELNYRLRVVSRRYKNRDNAILEIQNLINQLADTFERTDKNFDKYKFLLVTFGD